MALKLSKAELIERDKLGTEFQEATSTLQGAVNDYNLEMLDAWKKVEEALTQFNEARQSAIEWAHGIGSRIEDECADKSERWRESDKGATAQSFQQEYEGFDIEEVEIDQPDELPSPDLPEDVFEGLPEEVE
jgi:hypothetical protein